MKSGIIIESSVYLVCTYQGHYIATQMPSGKDYEFSGGAKVKVLKSDAEILLKRVRPVGCCGAPPVALSLFVVVGG